MENYDNYEKEDLNFLKDDTIQRHFADLNFALLNGKHILNDEDKIVWTLLDDYYEHFAYYYDLFYHLKLRHETRENQKFFFLDFYEHSKGKLSDNQRHRKLTERNVFFGILFLNLFFEKQFEQQKKYTWQELQEKIDNSEWAEQLSKILFWENAKTEKKWEEVRQIFRRVIEEFEEMGWTKWTDKDNFEFEIKVSIYRFIDLYRSEIDNIQLTIENYVSRK